MTIAAEEDKGYNSRKQTAPGSTQPDLISEDTKERIKDEPDSLGVDLDGTNPGSRSHPMDIDE